jgi:hypothetical protein
MKKILFLIEMVLFTCALNAQTTAEKEVTWDYPVKPGTEEWKKLKTVEEQFNAYNIPEGIIKNISTAELVKICLAYPEWGWMHAYNDRQTGFSVLISLFNGFRELFDRGDAGRELINVYLKMNPLAVDPDWEPLQQGLYSFRFTCVEMFLCQRPVINKLDKGEIKRLKEVVVSMYKKKKMLPEIYSLWNLSPTAGICLTVSDMEKNNGMEENTELKVFRQNLMADNIRVLDKIVEQTERSVP